MLINNCINYCKKFYPKVSYNHESIMLYGEIEDDSETAIDSMNYNEILGIVV